MFAIEEEKGASRQGGPADDAVDDNRPYPGLFSQDTMPAIIESLVIDDAISDDENQKAQGQAEADNGNRGHRRQRSSKSSQSKIMTSQEFEMYRRSKLMHQNEMDPESDDSQEEDEANEVDERKMKEEAVLHRQRQQAYIAEQRLNRRKVSGGGSSEQTQTTKPTMEPPGALHSSVDTWLSASIPAQPSSNALKVDQTAGTAYDDDDEDVPIALLAKARSLRKDGEVRRQLSPQNSLHPSVRPHTRERQLANPSPQPRAHHRPFTPLPHPSTMGHHFGQSMGVNNASQMSLPRPPSRRPHTSGGLVNRIETLESPSPRNQRRTESDPRFAAPLNPPRFYGRETPAPQPQPMMMMGGQFFPQQFQGGASYGAMPMNWGQFNQQGQQVGMQGYQMY